MINPENYVPLASLGLIKVSGPDALSFLQGQVTCDMPTITHEHPSLAAICDHKGRMLASFHIFLVDHDYYLLMPKSMRTLFLDHIKKYAAFSKVTLNEFNDWHILGSCSQTRCPIVAQISMPDTPRAIIIMADTQFNALSEDRAFHVAHENDWELANIRCGLAYVYPETANQLIPQMLNYQKFGAISFTKGCFVGQEVIARTEHLGKLKRHLHQASIALTNIKIGDEIMNDKKETVGIVVAAAVHDQQSSLLVVLQDHALEHPLLLQNHPVKVQYTHPT